jgi:outer membrane protein assembly factor BamB
MDLFRSRNRWHLGALLVAVASSTPSAQQDEWAQFRGNDRLTGVVAANAAPVPATPKVLWTWDAGDAIESSAAIAGDLVFGGAATGELVALNLSDGKKRWTYKITKPIGESSPAVANRLVSIGDLAASCTR